MLFNSAIWLLNLSEKKRKKKGSNNFLMFSGKKYHFKALDLGL